MIYQVFFKGNSAQPVYTHNMEVARNILKENFFRNMKMDSAIEISMDAIEKDTEKTGIIMSYRIKTKDALHIGTVTAIPEDSFFTETWDTENVYPQTFTVNFI